MKRFRVFLHRPLVADRLGDTEYLAALEVRGRWIPDPIEEFDEVDLALPLDDDRDLVVTLALEKGNLERMLLGWVPPGDDDADARAFTEEELAAALEEKGADLVRLMEYLSG